MTSLDPILPKLARLVPRLSSDQDGEVVATVRAIDRTLRGAGLDWHDLTSALSAPPPAVVRPQPRPEPRRPETWREIALWCGQHGVGRLSVKELSFVLDMAQKLGRFREPTERQAAWLRAIYDKLGGPQ